MSDCERERMLLLPSALDFSQTGHEQKSAGTPSAAAVPKNFIFMLIAMRYCRRTRSLKNSFSCAEPLLSLYFSYAEPFSPPYGYECTFISKLKINSFILIHLKFCLHILKGICHSRNKIPLPFHIFMQCAGSFFVIFYNRGRTVKMIRNGVRRTIAAFHSR